MARVLVTGSTDGLGRLTADALLGLGHEVVVHARTARRVVAVQDLIDRGAVCVLGDLSEAQEVRALADQVNDLGAMDAVIHNAGVLDGRALLPVNVVAPYVLSALLHRPARSIYLSSSMHLGGSPALDGLDWGGTRPSVSYSTSKLLLTTLSCALARRWPQATANAVDPGWVPTRMGGAGAPDDLDAGHRTQEWLAVGDEPRARMTGGYWYHEQRRAPHPAALDHEFQESVLEQLHHATGVALAPT